MPTLSLPRLAAAGAAAAALAAATPAAHADSISYIKDGNIHLTTPDGERDHQVTYAGGYSYASQADDGRIMALHGKRFQLLDQWGRVQADFSPVADGTAGTITLSGPYDPVISPDGSKVAYGFYVQYTHGDPNCGLPGGCWEGHLYAGTGYARATGGVDWNDPAFSPNYGWMDPAWIDNSRTLLSGPSSAYLPQTGVDTLGDDKHEATRWFSDFSGNASNMFDAEMNRQGTALATVVNTTGDELRLYRVSGAPAEDNPPYRCVSAPKRAGAWASPSWAPDGNRLAVSDDSGLYVIDATGIQGGCPDPSAMKVVTFAPGGRLPDWGPADLPDPSTRPVDAAGPQGPAAGGGGVTTPAPGGAGAGGGAKPADAGKVAALRGTVVRATRSAITVRVTVPAAGRLSAVGQLRGKTVATAPARRVAAGTTTLTLKATKNGRRALKRAGARAKVTVKATFTPSSGTPQRITLTR